MARLERETYSLMVSLLPATATLVGLVVLGQTPTPRQLLGISLVVAALALHRERATAGAAPRPRRYGRAGRAGPRTPGTLPSK
jgi:inner membrane transporter RhtA